MITVARVLNGGAVACSVGNGDMDFYEEVTKTDTLQRPRFVDRTLQDQNQGVGRGMA
jgi:hypothetical protein